MITSLLAKDELVVQREDLEELYSAYLTHCAGDNECADALIERIDLILREQRKDP